MSGTTRTTGLPPRSTHAELRRAAAWCTRAAALVSGASRACTNSLSGARMGHGPPAGVAVIEIRMRMASTSG